MTKTYEVTVRGRLSEAVIRSLGASPKPDSDTSVLVDVEDRSALHGFIHQLENLGLELVSLTPTTEPQDSPERH